LTCTTRDVHLRGKLIVAQVEVDDLAALDAQIFGQRVPDPEDESAVDLPAERHGVDDRPGVDHAQDVVDVDLAGLPVDGEVDVEERDVGPIGVDAVLVRVDVGPGDVDGAAAQQLGRRLVPGFRRIPDPLERAAELRRRVEGRLAQDVRRAAPADARIDGDVRRVVAPDAHARGIDLQDLRDDAGRHREHADADLGAAGAHVDGPVVEDAELDARVPAPDVARGERDPVAAPGLALAIPLHVFAERLEDGDAVGIVVRPAVEVGVALAHRVAQAELERVDPELARDRVDVRLESEERLHVAGRAQEAAGDRVRIDGHPLDAGVGDVVRRLGIHPRDQVRDDLSGRVGAAIKDHAHVHRDDLAVLGHAGPEPVGRRVPDVRPLDVVEIRPHVLDRALRRRREEVAVKLLDREALRAELAADEARLDDDLLLGQARAERELIAQPEGRLVGRDDVDQPVVVDPHERRARFDVPWEVARRRVGLLEDPVRAGERGVDVAVHDLLVPLNVRMRDGEPLGWRPEIRIALRVLVQDERLRRHRLLGVEDRRELFVLDLDGRRRGLRDLRRLGGDDRDVVADETHAVDRQDRPVQEAPAEVVLADVFPGQDRMDALDRARGRGVDRDDLRVRRRRGDEGGPQHPRHREIGGVLRLAGDFLPALDPVFAGLKDARLRAVDRRRHGCSASKIRSELMGRSTMRAPHASATALAIAGATPEVVSSPIDFAPNGPGPCCAATAAYRNGGVSIWVGSL
jgi:hypothetical protein